MRAMSSLPSYHEATTRPDWLGLVAPYIRFADYYSLCLVSRRFWNIFAPRLWRNLLKSIRLAGLDPSDDLAWWFQFVFTKLSAIRSSTLTLVRVLDTRDFAKDSCDFSSDQSERTLDQSFKRALEAFSRVDSILLDDHGELHPGYLLSSLAQGSLTYPLLLSIAHTTGRLPRTFFNSPSLQGLVYLDISGVPGSIAPLMQPNTLPNLGILKVQDRELDDPALIALATVSRLRLWSLDISENRISDGVIDTLVRGCFSSTSLCSPAHCEVEGKLLVEEGDDEYGPFYTIEESKWSSRFAHPERYYADAPFYQRNPHEGPQEYEVLRSDGLKPIRRDTADAVSAVLSEDQMAIEDFRVSRGLTHLHLSNNRVSAFGLEKLIRLSNGHIENFSCDSMPLLPPAGHYSNAWPPAAGLRGILGAAHVFRPVFSSNLRILRIHHSLVTNIPTLLLDEFSELARIHIAENVIGRRVDEAFPQAFVPDMNPRLTSLTLTCIPRRSSGLLTNRLIAFLKILSVQERAIQDVSEGVQSWRGPGMLKGLRHLRLEFEPDPMADGFSASEDLDAKELMDSGDPGFSFFGNEWSGSVATDARPQSEIRDASNSSPRDGHQDDGSYSDRSDEEFMTYHARWNGEEHTIPVWIGKMSSSAVVITHYRRLVVKHDITDGVGPVTPAQVLAGVPEKSYVFHIAWCMAVMPKQLSAPPAAALAGMADVLVELKRHRLDGKAKYLDLKQHDASSPTLLGEPHFFWTGNLEVSSMKELDAHNRPSQYWR